MKHYELFDIVWETDGNEVELPDRVVVHVEPDDIFDPEYDAAGYLSDNHGWLVLGCKWREI